MKRALAKRSSKSFIVSAELCCKPTSPFSSQEPSPNAVAVATGAQAVLFFLLEGKRLYRSGSDWTPHLSEDALTELSMRPASSRPQEPMRR